MEPIDDKKTEIKEPSEEKKKEIILDAEEKFKTKLGEALTHAANRGISLNEFVLGHRISNGVSCLIVQSSDIDAVLTANEILNETILDGEIMRKRFNDLLKTISPEIVPSRLTGMTWDASEKLQHHYEWLIFEELRKYKETVEYQTL
jgi:hypothetical protein